LSPVFSTLIEKTAVPFASGVAMSRLDDWTLISGSDVWTVAFLRKIWYTSADPTKVIAISRRVARRGETPLDVLGCFNRKNPLFLE